MILYEIPHMSVSACFTSIVCTKFNPNPMYINTTLLYSSKPLVKHTLIVNNINCGLYEGHRRGTTRRTLHT